MAELYKRINGRSLEDYVAHLPGVKAGVTEKAGEVKQKAKAVAMAADIPKGHRITGGRRDGITDSYIYLTGPFAAVVEWGRPHDFIATKTIFMPPDVKYPNGRFVPAGTLVRAFPGKHILRRTWEAM